MKKRRKSGPRKDITGQRFGKLIPQEYKRGGFWVCLCDCGETTTVDTRNLNSGHTRSCGCLVYASKNVEDMVGYETEFIKVLERRGSDNQQIAMWLCFCKNCGREFVTRGSSIRAGYTASCGCLNSLNEVKITQLLTKEQVNFTPEYTFPDLLGTGGGRLRFDFAVFTDEGELSHLIEYDGSQHYQQAEGSWADSFETTVEHDRRKKEYCDKNNIPLIIIRYDEDYNIKSLLNP